MEPTTTSLATSLVGNLASGIGSFVGGQSQARAARRAAEDYNRLMREGLDFQRGVYDTAKGQYDPYIQAGTAGLGDYQAAVQGFEKPEFTYQQQDFNLGNWKDPGYDFRLAEAEKLIQGSAAAKGGALGSGALKSLQTRGQDMASQEYANAYDRWLKDSQLRYGQAADQYGRDLGYQTQNISQLGDLAGMGSQAIGNLGTLGSGVGNSMMTGLGNMGEALGSAQMMQGKANAGGWNTLGTGLKGFFKDVADYYDSDNNTTESKYRGDFRTNNSGRMGLA